MGTRGQPSICQMLWTGLSVVTGVLALLRPTNRAAAVMLMPIKLLAGALAPLMGLVGAASAVWAIVRGERTLAGASIFGAGLAARLVRDIPDSDGAFAESFGSDWQEKIPACQRNHMLSRRCSLLVRTPTAFVWQRNLAYGRSSATGKALLADLWQPQPGAPRSGLGLIYVHGGGWRIGYKDMLTRPLFRRLASQGHVVLDIEYTLWPQADIPTMISEVKQAILWMKEFACCHGIESDRIVLMGGSAGAHLALMVAYTANDPGLPPSSRDGDTSVRGVVAFYAPVDLEDMGQALENHVEMMDENSLAGQVHRVAGEMLGRVFDLARSGHGPSLPAAGTSFHESHRSLLGGTVYEIPETYRSMSPVSRLGPHCPPTLLFQGRDDAFGLAPAVRRLHHSLQAAGVTSILVEFPHTDHAFDLVLPQVSPVAQAATYYLERFLALLV